MNTQTTDLITIEELCEVLSIGRNTAYVLLNTKKIKAFQIGRVWKIPMQSVEQFIRDETDHWTFDLKTDDNLFTTQKNQDRFFYPGSYRFFLILTSFDLLN